MPSPRRVLLVGEGNFSFSASLSRSLCSEDTIVIATCQQDEEQVLQYEGAANNINIIQDAGGVVQFGVDCTKLKEYPGLHGPDFDRIIFNFPHCGRKSGVKKNRELLMSFFLRCKIRVFLTASKSGFIGVNCVQVLSKDGEVHVTLCNGQGGTPADQPMRDWHNSWQVVAMAAEAGLLLSRVQPFDRENFESYQCTGYRSQDKGFHVEKALLHVFTFSLPFGTAHKVEVEETVDRTRVRYSIPAELSDYMFRDFLSLTSGHPVRFVQDFILKGLDYVVSMVMEPLPLLLRANQLHSCYCNAGVKHFYWVQDCQSLPFHAPTLKRSHLDDEIRQEDQDIVKVKDLDSDGEISNVLLRPSLCPQVHQLLQHQVSKCQPEASLLISGDEDKRQRKSDNCDICLKGCTETKDSQDTSVAGGNHISQEFGEGCNGQKTVSLSEKLLSAASGLVFQNHPITPWSPPVFHQLILTGTCPAVWEPVRELSQNLEAILAPYRVVLSSEQGCLHLTAEPMGLVGKVWTEDVSVDKTEVRITALLNLDLLAVLMFSLPDWRLLWSRDPRFLKEFQQRPSPGNLFHPFSLYPQKFSFDISFWTSAESRWDEARFHSLIREATQGTVEEVAPIDEFSRPESTQMSYCYRLVYCSHTHALSRTQALRLHKNLEDLLSARLKVTIR